MKIIFLVLALLSKFSLGVALGPVYPIQTGCISPNSHTMPTSYSLSDAGSNALELAVGTSAQHFAISLNTCSSQMAVSFSTSYTQAAPSASYTTNPNQLTIASGGTPALDFIKVGNVVLFRSDTGSTITSSCTVCAIAW